MCVCVCVCVCILFFLKMSHSLSLLLICFAFYAFVNNTPSIFLSHRSTTTPASGGGTACGVTIETVYCNNFGVNVFTHTHTHTHTLSLSLSLSLSPLFLYSIFIVGIVFRLFRSL